MRFFRKPSRRKNYIINRPFQAKFIAHVGLLAVGVLGIVYAANSFFFYRVAQNAVDKGIPPSHVFFRFVDQQKAHMNLIFVIAALVICALICGFGLFYSHRIAGPLHRLTQHLRQMTDGGAITELRFRKGDYFPEIADAFNAFLSRRVFGIHSTEPSGSEKKSDAKAS